MSKTLKRYAIALVLLLVGIFAVACTPDDPNANINANSVGFGEQSTYLVLDNPSNKEQQFKATISPANARQQTFVWSSSNESVARVNQVGLVQAVAAGKATISAKLQDADLSVEQEVTVYAPANVVNIADVDNTKLRIGHSVLGRASLDASVEPVAAAQVVTYRTDQPNAIDVNSTTGEVTARSQNINSFIKNAKVIATISGDYTADGQAIESEIAFELYTVPTGVNVDFVGGSINEVYVGGPVTQLQATVDASTAEQGVNWSSNNEYLVVNNNGIVTSRDIGTLDPVTATITATESVFGTHSDSQTVTVYQAPESIEIDSIVTRKTDIEEREDETAVVTRRISRNSQLALNANIKPFNAKQTLHWDVINEDQDGDGEVSSREIVGTVDQDGIFTAQNAGEVVVTVRDFFGVVNNQIKFVVEDSTREYDFEIKRPDGALATAQSPLVVGEQGSILLYLNDSIIKGYVETPSNLVQVVVDEYGNYKISAIGGGTVVINYAISQLDGDNTDTQLGLWHTQISNIAIITRTTDFVNKYSDLIGMGEQYITRLDAESLIELMERVVAAQTYASEISGTELEESTNNDEYNAILESLINIEEILTHFFKTKLGDAFGEFVSATETNLVLVVNNITNIANELFVLGSDESLITQDKIDELNGWHSELITTLQQLNTLAIEIMDGLNVEFDYYKLQLYLVDSVVGSTDQLQEIASQLGDAITMLQDMLDNNVEAQVA